MRYGDFFFLAAQRFRYQYARFNVNTADWRIKKYSSCGPSRATDQRAKVDVMRRDG